MRRPGTGNSLTDKAPPASSQACSVNPTDGDHFAERRQDLPDALRASPVLTLFEDDLTVQDRQGEFA